MPSEIVTVTFDLSKPKDRDAYELYRGQEHIEAQIEDMAKAVRKIDSFMRDAFKAEKLKRGEDDDFDYEDFLIPYENVAEFVSNIDQALAAMP